MQNNQAPEKQVKNKKVLQVHSIFITIQGEGPFAGRRALFVRLAGCNLQCPACDTEYTNGREEYDPAELTLEIVKVSAGNKLIVITGGEPFRQPISLIVNPLLSLGFTVQIETNGTLYDPGLGLTLAPSNPRLKIVCSPKTTNLNKELLPHIDAYKYVVKSGQVGTDGLPLTALDHPCTKKGVYRPAPFFPRDRIYVQPLDEGDPERNLQNLAAAVDSCTTFGYTFCLQIHKVIGLP